MMRWLAFAIVLVSARTAAASPVSIRCDDLSTADLAVDGLLDDWTGKALARAGDAADGAVEVRCSWDGTAVAFAIDVKDDRVVRVRGNGHEDRLELAVAAGVRATRVLVSPGNPIAKSKITRPARVTAADSLQRKGFSV